MVAILFTSTMVRSAGLLLFSELGLSVPSEMTLLMEGLEIIHWSAMMTHKHLVYDSNIYFQV